VYCASCGTQNLDGAAFCQRCGIRLAAGAAASATASAASAAAVTYAGFWRRVAAFLLDGILITVALGILGGPFGVWRGWILHRPSSFGGLPCFGGLFHTVAAWLYFALLESSGFQATLGKQVLGIVVTDLYGRRVSFARATARHFGKILSSITLGVGFAMAGFTARRQALHDILAECLVIRKP
jgi:uncharacterized RDD family membrane protein YckC